MNDKIGLKRGSVILKKHHEEWARVFKKEKANLKKLLGETALEIQHVGSTAIPGLSAKPIIDILMVVPSLDKIPKITPILEEVGYTYRENGSNQIQVLFAKGAEENRTHYLHITTLGSSEWKHSLWFRDYLFTHPEEVERYEKLKQDLAARFPTNRGEYTKGKQQFFEEIFKITYR